MTQLWCAHHDSFGDSPRLVDVEHNPNNPLAHEREYYVPDAGRAMLKGVHLFDTKDEADAALAEQIGGIVFQAEASARAFADAAIEEEDEGKG